LQLYSQDFVTNCITQLASFENSSFASSLCQFAPKTHLSSVAARDTSSEALWPFLYHSKFHLRANNRIAQIRLRRALSTCVLFRSIVPIPFIAFSKPNNEDTNSSIEHLVLDTSRNLLRPNNSTYLDKIAVQFQEGGVQTSATLIRRHRWKLPSCR
jgi:hypothetical protein